MKLLGIIMYSLTNIILAKYYIHDLINYCADKYNPDGIKYFIIILIADISFLFALAIIYYSLGFNKYSFALLILALLHNLVFNMPFIAITVVLISILVVFMLLLKHKSTVK